RLPLPDARARPTDARRAVHDVPHAGLRRRVRHVPALAHLRLEPALHGVLDVEDPVRAFERLAKRGRVLHVGLNDLGALGGERPGLGAVGLAGDRPHLPAVLEEVPGRGAAHAAGRAQDGDRASRGGGHTTSWWLLAARLLGYARSYARTWTRRGLWALR